MNDLYIQQMTFTCSTNNERFLDSTNYFYIQQLIFISSSLRFVLRTRDLHSTVRDLRLTK